MGERRFVPLNTVLEVTRSRGRDETIERITSTSIPLLRPPAWITSVDHSSHHDCQSFTVRVESGFSCSSFEHPLEVVKEMIVAHWMD